MKLTVSIIFCWALPRLISSTVSVCSLNDQNAPVNFFTGSVIQQFSNRPLTFTVSNNETFQITNTGQALIIKSAQSTTQTSVTGGPLGSSQYKQYLIQFYWSQDYTEQCCYSLDNSNSPLNIELVYWNTQYGSYQNAYRLGSSNGIFIVRVQVTVEGSIANTKFSSLESIIRRISRAGSSFTISGNIRNTIFSWFDVSSVNYQNYYSYRGTYQDASLNSVVSNQALYVVSPKATSGSMSVCQFTAFTGLKTSSGSPISAVDAAYGPTTRTINQYAGLSEIII